MVMQGNLYKKYVTGARGAGIEGDAILDDAEHKIPRAVIPIKGGKGIIIGGVDDIELSASVAELRAFSGRLEVGGTANNFGYEYYSPKQGTLEGGYALIEDQAIRVVELEYNVPTRVFRVGMVTSVPSVAPSHAEFANETISVVNTAGDTVEFKFSDGAGEATTYDNGSQSGYKWEWTLPAGQALWTAATASGSSTYWSITAPITVLNYVPHIPTSDNGFALFAEGGEPKWGKIATSHLPAGFQQAVVAIQDHLGRSSNNGDLNYLLYTESTGTLAGAFPVASYEPGAFGYISAHDGTSWDVGILRPSSSQEVVYQNRNRAVLTVNYASGVGRVDYGGASAGDDVYRNFIQEFSIYNPVVQSEDNAQPDIRLAVDIDDITDLTTAPTNLYVRFGTTTSSVITLPRLTGASASTSDATGKEYPQYGYIYTGGPANAVWYERLRDITRNLTLNADSQLTMYFYTNSAGSQALNIKPVRGRETTGKAWESIKPPVVSDWALASNTERIPQGKIARTATTFLHEGAGAGLSVTQPAQDPTRSLFTAFSPTFDLDDSDKQRGVVFIEVSLYLATRSNTNIDFESGGTDTRAYTLEGFHYPSALRSSVADGGTGKNGIEVADGAPLYNGTTLLGYMRVNLARNDDNELGYFIYFEPETGIDTSLNWSVSSTVIASFDHNDSTASSSGAELGVTQLPITTIALTPSGVQTWTAYSTVTDYTVLDDKAFFIDLHAKPTFSRVPTDGGDRVVIEWHALRVRGAVTTEIWDFVHYPRYITNFGTDTRDKYEWATANMFVVPGGQANDIIRIQARSIQQKATSLTTTFNSTNTDIKVVRLV